MNDNGDLEPPVSRPDAELAIPRRPIPMNHEMLPATPFPITEDRLTIGWQWRAEQFGGTRYATLRRAALGGYKEISLYPFTEDGWEQAWAELMALDPRAAGHARNALAKRAGVADSTPAVPAAQQVPARSSPNAT